MKFFENAYALSSCPNLSNYPFHFRRKNNELKDLDSGLPFPILSVSNLGVTFTKSRPFTLGLPNPYVKNVENNMESTVSLEMIFWIFISLDKLKI